jgi:hypothetical protein
MVWPAPPIVPRQGAVGINVGVKALADSGLMLVVSLLLYAELFPEFDAEDALSFLFALLDVLLWV